MKKKLSNTTIATLLFAVAELATAATPATATFSVSTTVDGICAITTTNPLTFAAFAPDSGSSQETSSSIGIKCTTGTPFKIGLGAGTGTGATTATRVMMSGSNTLNYQLFSDSSRTKSWGNDTGTGTDTVNGNGLGYGTEISNTVYARIPSQPDAVPGAYSDTITVSVAY